jgi:DNA (cytosine-5)-methyltransferase 1
MSTRFPTFGSLFAGIGGFDLGLERAGWACSWQVEKDPYCNAVLARHWPDVPRYTDVKELDPDVLAPVDLICGGFPCQDISSAGLRAGIGGEKSGLWGEMARLIRGVGPRFVLVENVGDLAVRGLDVVLGDLCQLGFDADWSVVPACALGASHARERLFIVAYRPDGDVSDSLSPDRRAATGAGESRGSRRSTRGDGWLPEPLVDRVAHGLPLRLVRNPLHALGNAVVPRVVEEIGAWLMEVA